MRPFEVTTPKTTVSLGADNKADVTFSVSNVSGRPIRANFVVLPDDPKTATWITVTGSPSFDFSNDNSLTQVPVRINGGSKTTEGSYSFKLRALSAEKPDDDYTDSPTVAFTVGHVVHRTFPWWIAAVVAGVIILGVIGYVIMKVMSSSSIIVPSDLAGKTPFDAAQELSSLGVPIANIKIACGNETAAGATVTSTSPPAGQPLNHGADLGLTLSNCNPAPPCVPEPICHFHVLDPSIIKNLIVPHAT
jgi:hypothetical protein